MNMEMLYNNFVNTTTLITPSQGGTSSISYLFDKKENKKFGSGDASDSTVTSIRIDFDTTQTVDRIALQNINLKQFKIYFNSNSANLISITSALTGTSSWTQNSETSLYLIFQSSTAIKSLFIECSSTMIAAAEKQIGELWVTSKRHRFDRNPTTQEYKVNRPRKEYQHVMSDGGVSTYVIDNKYQADIKRTHVTVTEVSELETIYNDWTSLIFVPFPTGTAWDGKAYSCNWIGEWDFDEFTTNVKQNGYTGTIRLREVAK